MHTIAKPFSVAIRYIPNHFPLLVPALTSLFVTYIQISAHAAKQETSWSSLSQRSRYSREATGKRPGSLGHFIWCFRIADCLVCCRQQLYWACDRNRCWCTYWLLHRQKNGAGCNIKTETH